MNPNRNSRAESVTLALLAKSVDSQLDELCLRLGLATADLNQDAARATRIAAIWDLCLKQGGTALADLEKILREQQRSPEALYWLSLSCSEVDRIDVFCHRFFNDLVSRLAPEFPDRDLRYFDEGNLDNPELWSPWALRAMCESQVLISLYTKSYFRSSYCGRVWAAFRQRLQNYTETHVLPAHPPLVFPVLWGPPDENPKILPLVARELAANHASFGNWYCEKGLRFIIQQAMAHRSEYEKAYDEFLQTFTSQLLQAAKNNSLPRDTQIAPLEQIRSVFYDLAEEGEQEQKQGAEYAKFVFFAARDTDDIGNIRRADAYGAEPQHWRPYFPTYRERITDLTNKAAYDAGFEPDVICLDRNLLTNMRAANRSGNIILVLVDPWTLRLGQYMSRAREYNDADLPRSTMLVCWNMDDRDTKRQFSLLYEHLQRDLSNKFSANSPARLRPQIESISQLRDELADALLSARRQIVDETESKNIRAAAGLSYTRPASVAQQQPAAFHPGDVRAAENETVGMIRQPRIEGPLGGTQA